MRPRRLYPETPIFDTGSLALAILPIRNERLETCQQRQKCLATDCRSALETSRYPRHGVYSKLTPSLSARVMNLVQCLGRFLRLCPLAVIKATLDCSLLKRVRSTDGPLLSIRPVFELVCLGSNMRQLLYYGFKKKKKPFPGSALLVSFCLLYEAR